MKTSQLNNYQHHSTGSKQPKLSMEETPSLAQVVKQWNGNPKAADSNTA